MSTSPGWTTRLALPIPAPSRISGCPVGNVGTENSSYCCPRVGFRDSLISAPRLRSVVVFQDGPEVTITLPTPSFRSESTTPSWSPKTWTARRCHRAAAKGVYSKSSVVMRRLSPMWSRIRPSHAICSSRERAPCLLLLAQPRRVSLGDLVREGDELVFLAEGEPDERHEVRQHATSCCRAPSTFSSVS